MFRGSLLLDQEYILNKGVFKVSEKLSKDDVLAMGRYIPLMLEDLREEKSERYMQLQVKWDMYNKNGCMGYDITNLYLLCKEQLSDAKKVKYP